MKINLLDVGEEGHNFEYKTGDEPEIDALVKEVVPTSKSYAFQIYLAPGGDIYTANGTFTLEIEDECSLCAADLTAPVKGKFSEYLVRNEEREAKGHAPHNGLDLENPQDVTFITGYDFDIGEFIREQFAVAVPPYPKCQDTQACEERKKENLKYYEAQKLAGHPAFSVLNKLKKQ